MATAVTANRAELIAIANSVAAEKMIDRTIVIEAMEDAIQRAARARFVFDDEPLAEIPRSHVSQRAQRDVGIAARRVGHDQLDRA